MLVMLIFSVVLLAASINNKMISEILGKGITIATLYRQDTETLKRSTNKKSVTKVLSCT